jgi:hypothetical protein
MTEDEYEIIVGGLFPSGESFQDVHKFLATEEGFYSQAWGGNLIHEDIAERNGVDDEEVLGGGVLEVTDEEALRLYGDSTTYGGIEHSAIEGFEDEIVAEFEQEYNVDLSGLVLESDESYQSAEYVQQKLRDAHF